MTASLLVSFSVVATGNQGKPAGTGPRVAPGRLDPTTRGARRAGGAPLSVEDADFTLSAWPAGPKRPQGGSQRTHGGGGNRGSPGAETLLAGGSWDAVPLAVRRPEGRGKTGARAPDDACLPLATSSGVPGPRLCCTLGGAGGKGSTQRTGLTRPAVDKPVDDAPGACGEPVECWGVGWGGVVDPDEAAVPVQVADQRECRAPGVDGKFRSWGEPRPARPRVS